MNITKKSLAAGTIAATALAGFSFALAPAADAAPAVTTKTFSKSFGDLCTVGPFGDFTLPSVVSGTVPTTVKRGAAFNLTKSSIKVTVPSKLNQQAYAAQARYQTVTFQTVNLNNKDVAPATKNTLTKPLTTIFVAVPPMGTTSFTVPTTGGLTVALKGGAKAGTGSLGVGAVKATFTLYNAQKQPILSNQPVTCAAPKTYVTLTTIKVS